jgi:hypothetical protein
MDCLRRGEGKKKRREKISENGNHRTFPKNQCKTVFLRENPLDGGGKTGFREES